MATSYKKTTIQAFPLIKDKVTRDTLYWKHLEFPVTKKLPGSVSYIEFSPVAPHPYAVTSSFNVHVHSPFSQEAVKTYTRFQDIAHCGSFRRDGALLVAGGNEGQLRLFETKRKSLLRVFKGHTGPVQVSHFTAGGEQIYSGSDDSTVRVWDVAAEKEVACLTDHTDYVRCGTTSQAHKDLIITGCYDHKVRVHDVRSAGCVLTMDHGYPVESVLAFPAGGVVLSAGGNHIRVWDALAGGRLLTTLTNHHKTVTVLGFCSNYQRLVSASLDRHVKIYDVGTYKAVHTLDFPSAILSMAISPDDSLVVVGTADGLLSTQRRRESDELEAEKLAERKRRKGSYRYSLAAKTYTAGEEDSVIGHKRREKLEKYDKLLRKFEHSRALDAAMDIRVRMKTPEVTVSVFQELVRRGALRAALAGRDPKGLGTILKFLQKNMSNPKFMTTIVDVTNVVLDVYTEALASAPATLEEGLGSLKTTVDQEVAYLRTLTEVLGTLDTLFSSSQAAQGQGDPQGDLPPIQDLAPAGPGLPGSQGNMAEHMAIDPAKSPKASKGNTSTSGTPQKASVAATNGKGKGLAKHGPRSGKRGAQSDSEEEDSESAMSASSLSEESSEGEDS